MKPNFALSLSADGLRLLHRVVDGWRIVGQADIHAPGLAEELGALRRTASALEPAGVRCKVVIPNDQIRYLTIATPTPDTDIAICRAAAAFALQGATPYAVSDLVFDISLEGDVTHIAAVAKETLAEAEAFASEHRLNPVSFVATPGENAFPSEPFFGQTAAAEALLDAGESVHPDTSPIVVLDETQLPKADARPETETDDPVVPNAEFISRRTVPTFRTQPPDPAIIAGLTARRVDAAGGFAEPSAHFETRADPAAKRQKQDQDVLPAPKPVVSAPKSEAERLTIFGARQGKPLSRQISPLGLTIAALGVVAVGILAFTNSATTDGLSGLFNRKPTEAVVQFSTPPEPQVAQATAEVEQQEPPAPPAPPPVEAALSNPPLSDEDAAVLDALNAPVLADPTPPAELSQEDLRLSYAVTGIWPLAPDVPSPPALVNLEDLYVTSIDPINPNFDAVALPALKTRRDDDDFKAPASPAPAGTTFSLDEKGLVIATPEGSLNPDGVMVFAGTPPVRQPPTLLRVEEPGEDLDQRLILAAFRPNARPADLIETTERATLDGLTRSELGRLRPRLRPASAQEENALASASLVRLEDTSGRSLLTVEPESDLESATSRAVAASLRPDARPENFGETIARARQAAPKPQVVAAASVAPRAVTPTIPSSASTSREATVKNAINLRDVNLIGVYGQPSSRRALVRLGNGRFRKVQVGDRIDGGLVSAIGDAELRYQKRGKAVVLKMPRG